MAPFRPTRCKETDAKGLAKSFGSPAPRPSGAKYVDANPARRGRLLPADLVDMERYPLQGKLNGFVW